MVQLVLLAACNLNQWAMDFDWNLTNIIKSIEEAKSRGCRFRTGPELELSGYGCEDHFYEPDTIRHCWQSLATILTGNYSDDFLLDIGMPIMHRGVRFNCRVFLLNRRIILIRPKIALANDGNYREERYFTEWQIDRGIEEFHLPENIRLLTGGQKFSPFGHAILQLSDTSISVESCEELFSPISPSVNAALNGAEIIVNGSGSHHTIRKLFTRLDLIKNSTSKNGGIYLYSNQQGCDGGRLYYDGCANIAINGEIVAQGSQFSVLDREIITAVVDLESVRSYRAGIASRNVQAAAAKSIPVISVEFTLSQGDRLLSPASANRHQFLYSTPPIQVRIHLPEEEIALGPACWLWDYLRRSNGSGFFLPLSGGADSSATAAIVSSMCRLIVQACKDGDSRTIADARRVTGESTESKYIPVDHREFASRLFHTCYMGTKNSSNETRQRAKQLSDEIGSYHVDSNIDSIVDSSLSLFQCLTGKKPIYKIFGGTQVENLSLQNLQARIRMIFGYLLAQLLPWVRNRNGFLIVLGSANVDEALRGYLTKYDCSSADINPIGGIAKGDLKKFLYWAAKSENLNLPALKSVVEAPPTAELEPITENYTQTDEVDMGFTYEELGIFGRLRKLALCGPVSMYEKARANFPQWNPSKLSQKVRDFFYYYSVNRHKLTTITPSYHAENYSPDDNRFDHRQFLYNTKWNRQFNDIKSMAEEDQLLWMKLNENNNNDNNNNNNTNEMKSEGIQFHSSNANGITNESEKNK